MLIDTLDLWKRQTTEQQAAPRTIRLESAIRLRETSRVRRSAADIFPQNPRHLAHAFRMLVHIMAGRDDFLADRSPTLTVHADPRRGLPSQLRDRVEDRIEEIELPPGYRLEWGGEHEDSSRARSALAEPIPWFFALMAFIVVALFNSIRTTVLIWLVMPLCIIAVTAGLLLTGMPFGFMALLGLLALGGELIKNQIVVVSKIKTLIDKGEKPYQSILDACTSKMRPICMVVLTTVLGMIPLVTDPFFSSMAVTIMFGLSFAAVLSLLVTPVLYAIFYGIREEA